jgi:hypothetical protein
MNVVFSTAGPEDRSRGGPPASPPCCSVSEHSSLPRPWPIRHPDDLVQTPNCLGRIFTREHGRTGAGEFVTAPKGCKLTRWRELEDDR